MVLCLHSVDGNAAQAASAGTHETNRFPLLVLGYHRVTPTPSSAPWSLVAQDIFIERLKLVNSLRVLPIGNFEHALKLMHLAPGEPVSEPQARGIAELAGAEAIVWVDGARQDEGWVATARILVAGSENPTSEVKAKSADPYELGDLLADKILGRLNLPAATPKRAVLARRWTGSLAGLECYGKAKGAPTPREQEELCRRAISADGHFIAAYDLLLNVMTYLGKWDEVEKVAGEVLRLEPEDARAHRMLGICYWTGGKPDDARRELEVSARLDPDDADTFARLGFLYSSGSRSAPAIGAYSRAIRLDPYGSQAATVHAQLGLVLARESNRNAAVRELNKASQLASANDAQAEEAIANGYATISKVFAAVEHSEKYLAIAKWREDLAENVKACGRYLAEWKPRLTPTYLSNAPPVSYDEETLKRELQQKLGEQDAALAENPIAATAEMKRWALEMTAGATNDLQKARMLFEALLPGVNNTAFLAHSNSVTAREVFAEWGKPGMAMHCQEASFLFIALARAAGLRAYAVSVGEGCDGTKTNHGCAAVFFGDQALLIDLTYFSFGAAHRQFTILDDVQTIAVHLCTFSGLQPKERAVKLAPDLPLVQANLALESIRENRWGEARPLIAAMAGTDTIGALRNWLEGMQDMHEGRLQEGIGHVCKAIRIDPHNYVFRVQLGHAYSTQGKLAEAREALREALGCPHTAGDEEEANRDIARLDDRLRQH